ncbi:hypothetical protein C8F01DRAFT_1161224, partial [Mycena amicta]
MVTTVTRLLPTSTLSLATILLQVLYALVIHVPFGPTTWSPPTQRKAIKTSGSVIFRARDLLESTRIWINLAYEIKSHHVVQPPSRYLRPSTSQNLNAGQCCIPYPAYP